MVIANELWAAETPGVNDTMRGNYRACGQEGAVPFDENEEQ